jgi:hypothetical protein
MAYGWDDDELVGNSGCADGWNNYGREVTGICPDCEGPVIDGEAASGCGHSPVGCETCGDAPCDQSC